MWRLKETALCAAQLEATYAVLLKGARLEDVAERAQLGLLLAAIGAGGTAVQHSVWPLLTAMLRTICQVQFLRAAASEGCRQARDCNIK